MAKRSNHQDPQRPSASAVWFAQRFGLLALVWIALNGLDGLALGLSAAGLATGVGLLFARGHAHRSHPLRWIVFAGFFLLESIRGGADVAWRALQPSMQLKPEFSHYPIALPAGLPTTLLTSLVSLLPGTLSVRLHEQEQVLKVHALTPSAISSVRRLEDRLSWVFRSTGQCP